jgi:hypothetical protein
MTERSHNTSSALLTHPRAGKKAPIGSFYQPRLERESVAPKDVSMSLKKSLMEQGMKLLGDPRVVKLMQNEQFMKAMMTAISMPGKIDGFTKEQAEKFAKRMSLATSDEVKDLRRTIRALEDQIAELKRNSATR